MLQIEQNIAYISGVLDCDQVPLLWRELEPALNSRQVDVLSLEQVEQSNSAALVLILEARSVVKDLQIQHVPENVIELAKLSNVENLIL